MMFIRSGVVPGRNRSPLRRTALPDRTDLLDEGLLAPILLEVVSTPAEEAAESSFTGRVRRMDGSKSEQSRPR
jgi:hypothetical protein